jgi:two-component system sensor histidine kinase KdpD
MTEAAEAASFSQVDAVRTALLRAVSHDLRTPIATIKALVTGLLERDVEWTPDQLREALTSVNEETDRLNRLVGNLLDASRLQIGSLAVHPRPTAIADVVDAAVHSLGREAYDVRIDAHDNLPAAELDPDLMERSLANLVANAIRYTRNASGVSVAAETVDGSLHVRVVDRGPGIPPTDRVRVLAPFQRLGDTDTTDGVGLGLAITRGFVEAMHGEMLLDDTPGGGLTVTLILPMSAADGAS